MAKFDLSAELKANPPKGCPTGIMQHPRVQTWLRTLLDLRAQGFPVTNTYIAEKLTKGARTEGLIPSDAFINEQHVRRFLAKRG